MIEIYTDGACSNNGKTSSIGGWGFVVLKHLDTGEDLILEEDWGARKATTNQQMELTAAVMACRLIQTRFPFEKIKIYSDSAYLINCYNEKWYFNWERNGWVNSKRQPVANAILWKELIPFFSNPNIEWIKVKGHTGERDWNDYVDNLAVRARMGVDND